MSEHETRRLTLVPLTLALMKTILTGKERLGELLGVTVPDAWPGADLADALPIFMSEMEQAAIDFPWNWLIVHREDRVIVGDAGFMGGPKGGMAEIGYSIVPEYRNQGYATEAVLYLIHWALHHRDIRRITAQCLNDNLGSIKVLEKVGMRQLDPDGIMLQWETHEYQ